MGSQGLDNLGVDIGAGTHQLFCRYCGGVFAVSQQKIKGSASIVLDSRYPLRQCIVQLLFANSFVKGIKARALNKLVGYDIGPSIPQGKQTGFSDSQV